MKTVTRNPLCKAIDAKISRARTRLWKSLHAALAEGCEEMRVVLPDRTDGTPTPPTWDALSDLWRDLRELFLAVDPDYRHTFVAAGRGRRWRQTTLEAYLRMLATTTMLSYEGLGDAAGVDVRDVVDWLLSLSLPTTAELDRLIVNLGLDKEEGRLVHILREDALPIEVLDAGLESYLEERPNSLAPALINLRVRAKKSVEAMAALVSVDATLWESWELRMAIPTAQQLKNVLEVIDWKLDGWRAGSGCARDGALWSAYRTSCENSNQETYRAKQLLTLKEKARRRSSSLRKKRKSPRLEALRARREASEQTLGGFLRYRRETKELSIQEIAAAAGVKPETWEAWECGYVLPSLSEVETIAPRIFVTDYLREKLRLIRQAA